MIEKKGSNKKTVRETVTVGCSGPKRSKKESEGAAANFAGRVTATHVCKHTVRIYTVPDIIYTVQPLPKTDRRGSTFIRLAKWEGTTTTSNMRPDRAGTQNI